MQKLIWQNSNGESVDLTQAPYGITNWEGFANTSLNIQSQQVPFQDGGVFLDALMEQRELSVTLAIQDNNDLEARYRMRRELIHILNPKLGEGYLIYKNDFTEKRIKCVAQIPLFETHNSNDSGTPKASLAWTACEPYWEDLEETFVGLERGEVEIENTGDIECPVEIQFTTSSNTNLQIENKTSGKVIGLNGVSDTTSVFTSNGKKQVIGKKFVTESFNKTDINGVVYDNELKKYFYKNESIAYSPELNLLVRPAFDLTSLTTGVEKSTDGENWTYISISGLETTLQKIKWIPEVQKFVGVATNYVVVSSDSENWTLSTLTQGIQYQAIGYTKWHGSYVIMIAGTNGCYATSEDGNTWEESSLTSVTETIKDIIMVSDGYSNETVFIGTNGFLYYGGTRRTSGVSVDLNCITKGGDGCYYIVGNEGTVLRTIHFIDDVEKLESGIEADLNIILFTEETGIYCLAGNGGAVYQGSNIENLPRLFYNYGVEFNAIKYIKKLGKFFLWNSHKIVTTKNFKTYETFYEDADRTIVNLEYGNNTYIIMFNDDVIGHNVNGGGWEYTEFSNYNIYIPAYGITYAEKYKRFYLIYDYGNKIGYTTDGTSITEIYSDIGIDISTLCYADSIDTLVALSGRVGMGFYSKNGGQSFNPINTYGGSPYFMSCAWSDEYKMFIAGGHDDNINTSKDGINWFYAGSPFKADTYNIAYSDFGGFFLNGHPSSSHKIGFTTDGKSYQFIDITNTYSIASGNGLVCALGSSSDGAMVIITMAEGENKIQSLTENSNMDFYLKQGVNKIALSGNKDVFALVKYRQKYMGV